MIEIDRNLQRKVIIEVVRGLIKTLDERINQRMPGHSPSDKLAMKRSVVCHMLANQLLDATKEEIASYADLTGALINMTNEARSKPLPPFEEPVG